MPETNAPAPSPPAELRARQIARWEAGDRVPLEALLADRPGVGTDPDSLLDLIYAEVLLREEYGERPEVEEYVRRFPACEEGLRRQFAFHEAAGLLDTDPSSARGTSDDTLPLPPRQAVAPVRGDIGPYEVLGKVGEGGMGVVYRGRHRTLGNEAAVKVLRPGAGPQDRERFLTEARSFASLNHPNVVRIFEVSDPSASEPFVALEFVEGGTLADRIAGTPLPPREAAALLLPLAEATEHAHRRGVLHRDLKPANVLLSTKDEGPGAKAGKEEGSGSPSSFVPCTSYFPRVTDFGLARRLDDSALTRTGDILGTPSYMAPEQAAGRTGEVGPAADVYGLGAILYEMLTGRPPFRADTVFNTLAQVVAQDPVAPRSLQPGVPRDLDTICLKCLHKTPARRYGSAAALAGDLRRFLAGEPIQARPVGAVERAGKWLRRHPAAALLAGSSALALAAFVALWVTFTLQLEVERAEAVRQKKRAEDEKVEARRQEKIARDERAEAQKQSARARHLLELSATAVDTFAIAARNAKSEERASGNTGEVLFKLACFYARTSKVMSGDADLSPADRRKLAEQYATSAVRLLNCAEQVGFFGVDRPDNRRALEKNPDLDVVRPRRDYKALLARVR